MCYGPLAVERRSISHRLVFLVLAVTLSGAFLVALFIHERFARHQARAALHLPGEVEKAFRLDVEQTQGFAAFERHLLPLMELGREGPEPRVKHLERKTTIEMAVDAREVVFAEIGNEGWLLLVSGLFRRGEDVVAGVLRLAQEEGIAVQREGDTVVLADGPTFAVAEDGTLILASHHDLAVSARRKNRSGSFKALLQKPAGLLSTVSYRRPEQRGESGWERFWAFLEPGEPHGTYLEIVQREGAPPPSLERLAAGALGLDAWGELTPQAAPEGVVAATSTVSSVQFDRAVASLGGELSEHLSRSFDRTP